MAAIDPSTGDIQFHTTSTATGRALMHVTKEYRPAYPTPLPDYEPNDEMKDLLEGFADFFEDRTNLRAAFIAECRHHLHENMGMYLDSCVQWALYVLQYEESLLMSKAQDHPVGRTRQVLLMLQRTDEEVGEMSDHFRYQPPDTASSTYEDLIAFVCDVAMRTAEIKGIIDLRALEYGPWPRRTAEEACL